MKITIIMLLVFAMCFTAACGGAVEDVSSASEPESVANSGENSEEVSGAENAPEASESLPVADESVEIGQPEPEPAYGDIPVRVDVDRIDEEQDIGEFIDGDAVVKHFNFYDGLVSYYLTYKEIFDLDAEGGFAEKMAKYNDSYFESKALVLVLLHGVPRTEYTVNCILENANGGIDMEISSYIDEEVFGKRVYSYLFVELPEGMGTEQDTVVNLEFRRDYPENYDPEMRPAINAAAWAERNPEYRYPVQYQYWRGSYAGCVDNGRNIVVLSSVEELEEYRNVEKHGYYMLHAIERYDEEYFKEQVLIIVYIFEGSGTPRHKPLSASPDGNGGITLEICEYFSGWGTCDLGEWTMLIEPVKGLKVDSADKVDINWSHDYLENYEPEHAVYHAYAKDEQIKDGPGIEYTEDVEVTIGYSYSPHKRLVRGADGAEMATLLANLDYKQEEVCRCPTTLIFSFDGRVYYAEWYGNYFIRCDEGQVALTEAQTKRLMEFLINSEIIAEAVISDSE